MYTDEKGMGTDHGIRSREASLQIRVIRGQSVSSLFNPEAGRQLKRRKRNTDEHGQEEDGHG